MISIAFAVVRCDTNDDGFKLEHKLNRQTDLCVKFMNLCVKCLTNGNTLNTNMHKFIWILLRIPWRGLVSDFVILSKIGHASNVNSSEMNAPKLDQLISVSCIVSVGVAHKSWKISKIHYRNWIWPRGRLYAAPSRARLSLHELRARRQNIIIIIISENSHGGRSPASPPGSYNLPTTQSWRKTNAFVRHAISLRH